MELSGYDTLKNLLLKILHSFVKKDQKTPKKDLEIALKRKKEIDNANG